VKILSLDTTMAACSVAVLDTDHAMPLAAAFVAMERGHAEALAPMVGDVMNAAEVSFPDIDRIAVTTGPGTFTGVRIGLALARGIGLARRVPVVGIDTLSAIAANEPAELPLLVVCDARNDEVYAASFDSSRALLRPPQVLPKSEAALAMPAGALVLGTAARLVMEAGGRHDLALSNAGSLPVAGQFARLAASRPAEDMPTPLYLRAPDAKPQRPDGQRGSGLSFDALRGEGAGLLASLHREIFGEPWDAKDFAELLAMPGAESLVAREDGEPLGFLMTRVAADEAEIITIGTRPCAQRRGVARQMLEHQLTALRRRGIRQAFLEVAASNTAALGLYALLGFREVGRRRGYYGRSHGAEDAIVMRRELAA
jgi:tRNA threonylcarbamoyladenosine biosynthesis protein TsaB